MTKSAKKTKKIFLGASVLLIGGTLFASQLLPVWRKAPVEAEKEPADTATVSEYKGKVENPQLAQSFDSAVVKELPEGMDGEREISVIVESTDESLVGAFDAQKSGVSRYTELNDYLVSGAGQEVSARIERANASAERALRSSGVKFTLGSEYENLIGGFEVVVKARDYSKLLSSLSGTNATAYISEEYAPCETQVVENKVNVHGTGIFNNDSEYDGSGTVIAVLDTGLDYTHSAFNPDKFHGTEVITRDNLAGKISSLKAADTTSRLTAAAVYRSPKVPYAYDYADKDVDVYPLESEHGTHVSGVIVGLDDEITGVAPNAQLASMKVFSDLQQGARQSWLIAALEDCVTLGVDVINMSLGSAAGFSEESDERLAVVYDRIEKAGISLVCAASNDYNSTFGSEKNGNLGLTTNPDSATVGSPSTYSAALSVASISGVKTPYLKFGETIIYFTEASNASSEPKNFVNEILPPELQEKEFEFQYVHGIGRSADYMNVDVKGKIALVSRGSNTFEDKARIAQSQGAAGVIIFNNVSGDISMTVGGADIPVCSISKDNGEILKNADHGTIRISRTQTAGPFMSNFSSWGPTPDLRIKPEITAHGGDILSAVPGQAYDRLSGTSMASPNQAGVTALVRQYVKDHFGPMTGPEINAIVNELMMSTADVAHNVNGLPYAVRKQGAGLANLTKATTTPAYISTFARNDEDLYSQRFTDTEINKAKIELGDDPEKTGVYEMKFKINNAFGDALSYNVGAIVMTEGVSETLTVRGDMTVTQEGYNLEGATVEVNKVEGGSAEGTVVTVPKGGAATVTLTIRLGESDKEYLNRLNGKKDEAGNDELIFENGMYIEGYITLTPTAGTEISLSVPYLGFFGDWTEAPLFDLEYFETDKDDHDASLDVDKKTLPDAYATTPVGGLYNDYISYLGSYYFVQDPSTTQISADKKYIALTNQEGETGGVNYIYGIYAGMLRAAKRVHMTITDAATGEVIWQKDELNQRKSYSSGSTIYPSSIDVDFHVADYDLRNNSKYIFRAEGFLDYGDGVGTNKRNVFEFPFVTDFQSPVVTGCEFYTEYDKDTHKNRLFARASVYDNHYAMGAVAGRVYEGVTSDGQEGILFDQFSSRLTPIYSEYNSTTEVTFELTDYVDLLRGTYNPDTFCIQVYDYAMNSGTFEIRIPDSVRYAYFDTEEITLSPNETYFLEPTLYPGTEWRETLEYAVRGGGTDVIRIVNGRVLATGSGEATIDVYAFGRTETSQPLTSLRVTVLSEGDEGYAYYDPPTVDAFRVTGYRTEKAFYRLATADREIGTTGSRTTFSQSGARALSMFPSEAVTVEYMLRTFSDDSVVSFTSSDPSIATVDSNGTITAVAEGVTSVSINVYVNGQSTLYGDSIIVTVKNPYERNGPYLTAYRGNGGKVEIPADLGLTQLSQYAFSGYRYIPKTAEDEISEEDPSHTKPWYIGEDTITEVVIPEGIELIGAYAFAGLTSLERVVIPSTCVKIAQGAFYGCTSLREVEGLEHVKFINQDAFYGPETVSGEVVRYDAAPLERVDLSSVIAIGNRAFKNTTITELNLPASAQSIGVSAFENTLLFRLNIRAEKVKLGERAFAGCSRLSSVSLNADVIPDGVFDGCSELRTVRLGADVSSIGAGVFRGTKVERFDISDENAQFKSSENGKYLLGAQGTELLLVAPGTASDTAVTLPATVTRIGENAFSGNLNVKTVTAEGVTSVGDHAFDGCSSLESVAFAPLTEVGVYAFAYTSLRAVPELSAQTIGNYAFTGTLITELSLGDGVTVGDYAFADCNALRSVTIGNNATIGRYAFSSEEIGYYDIENVNFGDSVEQAMILFTSSNSALETLSVGENATIGDYAFAEAVHLASVTLGAGASIGSGAFYNDESLAEIDLSGVKVIGSNAFTGALMSVVLLEDGMPELDDDGNPEIVGYLESTQAPVLTQATLTALTELGSGAFANCRELASVTFGEAIVSIGSSAFANCSALTAADLGGAATVGENAFAQTALTSVDLSAVDTVGSGAFGTVTTLTSVTFKEGVSIGEQAFIGCSALATAEGLAAAKTIGSFAFANTALGGAYDFTSLTALGSNAFMGTEISSVTLPECLTEIGNNPFAGCPLPLFTAEEDVLFNGVVVDTQTVYDFAINDKLVVKGGVLYRKVPNGTLKDSEEGEAYGLELVTYPAAATARNFSVPEGTVRISDRAFENARLVSVELPLSLLSIGDKAFFGCERLSLVTFKSLAAPILEEAYSTVYSSYTTYIREGADGRLYSSIPIEGLIGTTTDGDEIYGLGLYSYHIWNLSPTMYLYGATFGDYIGFNAGDYTMVRPSNGTGYNSFVYGKYFSLVIDGALAPEQATLDTIAAIDRIPASVSLADEPLIVEARRMYDSLSTAQQSLVTNYEKLTAAEHTLEYIKGNENPGEENPGEEQPKGDRALIIALSVLAGVFGLALIAVGVCLILRKKNGGPEEGEPAEGGSVEEETAAAEGETPESAEESTESAEEPTEATEETPETTEETPETTEETPETTEEPTEATEEPTESAENGSSETKE